MPHLRPEDGPARGDDLSVSTPRPRHALAVLAALLCSAALAACGGSSVSDKVPKSTPDLTPPADTSAEKAAVQTTSTSTTTTKSKTGSTSESTASESEGETPEGETGGSASEGTASGGTGSEEKATEKESAKEEGNSSPTGGASAP